MIALVGLGNPGEKYDLNRHNVGHMVLNTIINGQKEVITEKKLGGQITNFKYRSKNIKTFKSNDFMNECGISIKKFISFYKFKTESIYVIHDDLDLQLGKVKIKFGGSSGGHNGLKSIDSMIGKDYFRIRIGISHPGSKELVNKHVLSNFKKQELITVNEICEQISTNFGMLMHRDKSKFLNKVKQ